MQWYSGGIAEAITESKAKGAIFVVYIEGKDEESEKLTKLIDTETVSSKLSSDLFVAIKLEANSVPHKQFSEIYKETPVPALYFIAKNGVPLSIVSKATDPEDFIKSIDVTLSKAGIKTEAATPSENLIKTEQQSTVPPNVVCENGVCTIKREEPSTSNQISPEGEKDSLSPEEKMERAKKLLESKREQKEQEEKEKERQKEIERRKMGQNVQQLKKWQEEEALKQLIADREKERKESQAARDRVLAQIAQDKAERASKFTPQPKETKEKEPVTAPSSSNKPNVALLQFKLPDGGSHTRDFPSQDTLQTVVDYIKSDLNLPYNNFTLSMTFPRRQFTANDHSQTLADLGLTPNAVILILPLNHGAVTTNPSPGGVTGFVWGLLTPFLQLFGFLRSFIFGGGGNVSGEAKAEPQGASRPANPLKKRPAETTIVRRQGNVHRLADNPEDDDDTNTWNGNSTQQM